MKDGRPAHEIQYLNNTEYQKQKRKKMEEMAITEIMPTTSRTKEYKLPDWKFPPSSMK